MGCKAVKILFAHKSKYINSGIDYFSGYVYYILNNKNEIIRQIVQLNKDSKYRPNDTKMLSTSYYKNIKNIRSKIFDFVDTDNTRERYVLSKRQLNEINKYYLLKGKKFKKQIDLITGSNYSGAEKSINADNTLTIMNNNYYRFSNFFNKITISAANRKICWIGKLEDLELISLEKFLKESSELLKKKFSNYNIDLISDDDKNFSKYKDIDYIINKYPKSSFQDAANVKINSYENKKMKYKSLISALRTIHRIFLYVEAKKNKYPKEIDFLGSSIKDSNLKEAAHIISVSDCKKNNELISIANPNNGLLLSQENHKIYDKNLKSKFICEAKNKFTLYIGNKKIGTIRKEVLNKNRIKFLEKISNN